MINLDIPYTNKKREQIVFFENYGVPHSNDLSKRGEFC